jgi:dynein heavy chain
VLPPPRPRRDGSSQYIGEVVEIYRNVDLEEFSAAIDKFQTQTSDFKGIPHSADIGIVRADSKELKIRLMPSPVQCLVALQNLLPELISAENVTLLKDLGDILPTCASNPTNVDDFVKKTTTCTVGAQNMESFKKRSEKVDAMTELMNKHEWVIPDDIKVAKRMVTDDLQNLETAIEVAQSALEVDTQKFAAEVDSDIDGLNKQVLGPAGRFAVPPSRQACLLLACSRALYPGPSCLMLPESLQI